MKLLVMVMLIIGVSCAGAAAQGTAFSYQGRLEAGGTPATGDHDLEFRVFDAPGGGAQQGNAVQVLGVAVTGGVFAVTLDFGVGVFTGADRFLDISVRAAGGGAFTPLAPRQSLLSTPYSVRSSGAGNADQLGGVAANQYVLTGDPRLSDARPPTAGSTSYIQNTGVQQPASNFNISGSGTAGGTLSANILAATTQLNMAGTRMLWRPGTNNIFFGANAGGADAGSSFNVFVGTGSAFQNTTGSRNTFVGDNTGVNNITGNNNTLLGYRPVVAEGLTNATAIGSQSQVTQSNSMVLGSINGVNGATVSTNVGIGTTAPSERLHVVGNSLFTGNATVTGTLTATLPAGSTSYIQNQNAVSQAATNFSISGTGQANIMSATTQFNVGADRVLALPGTDTLAVGRSTGSPNAIGVKNVFVGTQAGQNTTSGANNVFVGYTAGQLNTTGIRNTFVGSTAGTANVLGADNSFFGFTAGTDNTGSSNSFFGSTAGGMNTTGQNNSFFGRFAGGSNLTGNNNAFFGVQTGSLHTSGIGNSFFGYQAGNLTNGNNNAFFGMEAGDGNIFGDNNTMIGALADVGSNNLSNATAVGFRAQAGSSNSLVLGSINGVNGAAADTNVGIGTTQPTARLHVVSAAGGDNSVMLPGDSIGSAEIVNEAGAASNLEGVATVTLDGTLQALLTRTITVPTEGTVLAIGTLQANAIHTNGITSTATFGVSDTTVAFPGNQDIAFTVPGTIPSGTTNAPVTVHGLFQVGAGAHDFYLLADEASGNVTVNDTQLTLIFIPTAYGTIMPSRPAGALREEIEPVPVDPIQPAETTVSKEKFDEVQRQLAELKKLVCKMNTEAEVCK